MFKKKNVEMPTTSADGQKLVSDNKLPVLDSKTEEAKPENLLELIEKNIKWTQVVYEQNKQIKHRLTLMVLGGYIKLALIVVPIILALIFLPPLFRQWFGQYSELLNGLGDVSGKNMNLGQDSIQNILKTVSPSQIQSILDGLNNK
jgi:hypothetical protein